jgi:hypothetical protein
MLTLNDLLLGSGIAQLPDLYSAEQITHMNTILGPFFAGRADQKRSYAHPDELVDLGLWNDIFSAPLLNALFTIMPDPVLYHAHAYEIAANDSRSHIFSESLLGWHRDPDSAYVEGLASHVSIFIYLTNVGAEDGAFEFVPDCSPKKWLTANAPIISVRGAPGFSFAWARRYYHRASPNRGPVRRRLLKLSIQKNAYLSAHLGNEHFKRVLAAIPVGDPHMDLLLGRYQGKQTPVLEAPHEPVAAPIAPTSQLNLSPTDVLKAQLREKAKATVDKLRGKEIALAAYD